MNEHPSIVGQLRLLRQQFDEGFSRPPEATELALEDFLLLKTGTSVQAVPLSQIALLQGNANVTTVPSHLKAWIGVCGVRGELLAVFDLATCLGQPRGTGACPWLIRARGTSAAFAFERFEGHVRVPGPAPDSEPPAIALHDGRVIPLLSVDALVAAWACHVPPTAPEIQEPNHV